MRQIILDTETTGLEPSKGHRIIEFAALEMVNRKLTGLSCHFYIHPERDIDPNAERVHGISLNFLENKPKFKQVATQIREFIADSELVIHNAPFDIGFLNAEFARIKESTIDTVCAGVIDTLAMARERFPGKRNNLDILCDRFGIDRSNRSVHGALVDCELLAEVYLSLTRGQESLVMDVDDNKNLLNVAKFSNLGNVRLVQKADKKELILHEQYLDMLDLDLKASCLWRNLLGKK